MWFRAPSAASVWTRVKSLLCYPKYQSFILPALQGQVAHTAPEIRIDCHYALLMYVLRGIQWPSFILLAIHNQ